MTLFAHDQGTMKAGPLRLMLFSGTCLVLVLSAVALATADDLKPMHSPLQSCNKERTRFCSDKKTLPDIASCLIEHDKEVSTECQRELEQFEKMRKRAMSQGGGGFGPGGGPDPMGPPVLMISYEGIARSGSISYIENKLNMSVPVYQSTSDTVALSLSGGDRHLNNSITLDSGKKVPTDLYRTDAGIQYFNQLSENRNWGLRGSVGYVGDKPSANSRDITYGFNANYNFPGSGNGAWMLSVMFSNNGPLLNYIPIPGVAYLYKTDTFFGMFGFPFASMRWTPDSFWSYSLALMGPMVQSEIDYGGMDRIQYFSGFSWTRDSYIQSDRENDKDRLTIEEKKAAVGFRAPAWGQLTEFQFGRAFDRSIYIGKGLFDKDGGSGSLQAEWYLSASVKVKF